MIPDDRQLVLAVSRHGDERAFATLYRRYTPALYGLALRLTGGDAPDAQEIVHDAWVRGVGRFEKFEWRAALSTWLASIMIRRWYELLRERRRDAALPIDEAPAVEDAVLRGTYDRIDLERAMAGLASGYREILVLHDVHGYTHEEIGSLLGIDPGTSKSQLSRARRNLRSSLERPEGA